MFKIILILFFLSSSFFASDDLVTALKSLDNGNKAKAEQILKKLQKENPTAPETLLLGALLNQNAEEAKAVYEFLYEEYPDFEYADLCLFRLYSYNYAIGNYITAEKYLTELKEKFPNSPYAKAEKSLPKPDFAKETKNVTSNSNVNYTIQAGAFSNILFAKKLKEKFDEKGYSAKISKKIVGDAIFNVVTVGRFNSYENAKKRAEKISEEFNIKARVIKKF